jgi:uncharacterized protein YndB with AHSA1/START domain
MAKFKFTQEYSIKCTAKMLYTYISTDTALGTWFCDKANFSHDKQLFNFQWEGTSHFARIASIKAGKSIKLEFLPDEENPETDDLNYIELKISTSDLTQDVFLTVTDYSSSNDQEDLTDLWDGLIASLKEELGV